MQVPGNAFKRDQIADHLVRPRDDLTSFLLSAELGGTKLASEHVRGHHDPADDRRHRHYVVGHRFGGQVRGPRHVPVRILP